MISHLPKDLTKLLRLSVRKFYSPQTAQIYDILLEESPISQIDLIKKLPISYRELNKYIFPLKTDFLLNTESEINESRTILFYYIDPLQSYNILKYKMYEMNKKCEVKAKHTTEKYSCEICSNVYDSLEVQSKLVNYKFVCCETPLKLIVDEFDYKIFQAFMEDCREIIELLKKLEKAEIASLDLQKGLQLKIKNKEMQENEIKEKEKNTKAKSFEKSRGLEALKEISESDEMHNYEIQENPDIKIQENTNIKIQENENIFVSVNGVEKNINEITDEDLELMNEDEYEKFFDLKEDF